MRHFLLITAAVTTSLLLSIVAHAGTVALVADRLIDGVSDRAINDAAVVIEGEHIVAVGGRDVIPAGSQVIELGDMTLMPGMINAHEHPQLYADDYQNAHLQASSAYKTLRSCLLYTSPSPRDKRQSRMPSSA